MKALALTSPFSVVYIIHLLKLRRQVSTSVYKQFSTTLAPWFLHLGMQQWKGVLLSQTFPESVSASPKLSPKVFILILGFETHFCFSPSNCLTSSAVIMNMQQHSGCFICFKTQSQKAGTALAQAYAIWADNFSTSSSRHLQEWEKGKGKAENCAVLTNQLNNFK